uniref:ATP synthase complex subunit 8 n=1 Tax=Carpilius maculatus TaxID=205348 RepID=A0A7D3UJM2_9EUCA|nr:ATP synthase F0 subunit 8 [Carpilius maculatus]QKE42632.1 ATP synthase F0 subunit 8 [Carpilius maculatus]
MPQMAPLLWLCLYFFFLLSLFLFMVLTYYIKPFESTSLPSTPLSSTLKPWKL